MAKSDIARWNQGHLPLDIWGLDMNWRDTQSDSNDDFALSPDFLYKYPNTTAFPDFAGNSTAWFDYLKTQKLRTYFNDHPVPLAARNASAGLQTSTSEVAFRWHGLNEWMERGLTFWWL